MLKNYWYAVEFASTVATAPVQVRIFDQDLVLYRDAAGMVHCHSDICIHRGGSLAGGKVRGDCIECPYHGWRFDTEGACVKIPANREGLPIPKKARVDSYPVVERYGYLFVFLGDLAEDQRPPIPVLPLLDISAELQVKSDAVQLSYRRWRQAGIDRGWAIDEHRIAAGGRYEGARVIPSPARREHPELANAWVLKEMETREALRDRAPLPANQESRP